jgi:hypothetical protein
LTFIIGSSLKKVENVKEGWTIMKRNIEAVEMFLGCDKISAEVEEKMRQKFGEFDVGIEYTVEKWRKSIIS